MKIEWGVAFSAHKIPPHLVKPVNISVCIFQLTIIKEAAPKSSVTGGGVSTFSNKKGLVRRMTMIQSALDRYDLGEYFTYPQRDEKVC